ncbi:MAG: MarR family transcriptional regulator [Pseudomonadota bacterium]
MNEMNIIGGSSAMRLGEIGLNNFAPYLMNRIMGRYNNSLREEMAALGLTTPKMRSLAVLSVIDGILLRDLAVYAVVDVSTLSRTLDALEADGLVKCKTDSSDGRARRVFIADEGRFAFDSLWPHMSKTYERMFVGIGREERQAFVGTLQKMLANVRKHDL